jgi:DNA-binding FadR family transcriptional regulator
VAASVASQEHAVARAGKIFALLRQCAERGETCPKNAVLAERFSVGTSAIVSAFNFLECSGMIAIERVSNARVVTICATGKQTASELHRRAA